MPTLIDAAMESVAMMLGAEITRLFDSFSDAVTNASNSRLFETSAPVVSATPAEVKLLTRSRVESLGPSVDPRFCRYAETPLAKAPVSVTS